MGRDLWADCGLSDADYTVLVHLSEAGTGESDTGRQRVRMSDLAGALRWSKSRLSHQVGRMESRGLLSRQGCPSDARGSFAVLTDSGLREIQRAAPIHVARVRQHFVDLLSDDQLDALAEISEALIGRLLSVPGAPARRAACPGAAVTVEALEGKLSG